MAATTITGAPLAIRCKLTSRTLKRWAIVSSFLKVLRRICRWQTAIKAKGKARDHAAAAEAGDRQAREL